MHQVMNLAAGLTGEEQGSVADAAEALKSVDFKALLAADEADISVAFSPIPHDGAFFEGINEFFLFFLIRPIKIILSISLLLVISIQEQV